MRRSRIYLDNCCYNRPYDDQTQLRISLESQAKLEIQKKIKNGELELVTSYMTTYENAQNPIEIRRNNICSFQDKYASVYVKESLDSEIKSTAYEIEKTGIKHKDACHVACAIQAKCDYFITTDDRLLKYKTDKLKMETPVTFINQMEDMIWKS